jgi:hypothetical protein
MRDSNLLRLLRSLSPTQLNSLRRFLSRNYPVQNQLLQALQKYKPDFPPSEIDEQKIFQATFKTQAFNAQKLNACKYKLKSIIEDRLVMDELHDNPLIYQYVLSQTMASHQQPELFHETNQKIQTLLEASPIGLDHYWWELRQLIYMEYSPATLGHSPDEHAQHQLLEILEKNSILWKLLFNIEVLSKGNYSNDTLTEVPFTKREALRLELVSQTEPVFKLLNQLFLLFKTVQPESFFYNIVVYFKDLSYKVSFLAQVVIVRYIGNYAINNYLQEKEEYLPALAEFYEWALDGHIFSTNKPFSHTLFLNIFLCAVLSESETLKRSLMARFSNALPGNYRAYTILMCKAYDAFHSEAYDKAYHFVHEVRIKGDLNFGIRRQSILLRSVLMLYLNDQVDVEDLLNRTRAYRTFFQRNATHIKSSRINLYLNLEYFISRFVKILLQPERTEAQQVQKLILELEQEACLAKPWLLRTLQSEYVKLISP